MRSHRTIRTFVAVVAAAAGLAWATPARASVDPLTSQQWGLDLVKARAAWSVGRGAGTTIAVVDSGTDLNHEDLVANLVPGKSFVSETPQDDDGHGTHVSGIAAGDGDNGLGISGVAPEAKIMPVKVLTPDGGTVGGVADGIRHAADAGATVINLSVGADVPLIAGLSSTLPDAIRYAWSKGVICVLAAGNNSLPLSDYGNIPAIVVTAVDRSDHRAGYATSIGGAKWGMAAPGGAANGNAADDIFSTFWKAGQSNSYGTLAGTSMAAPFVSGAAALLRGLGLSPQATVDRLLATATDIGASGRDSVFGSGRLNVAAAAAGLGGGSVGTTDPDPSTPGATPATTRKRTAATRGAASPTTAATASQSDRPTTSTEVTVDVPEEATPPVASAPRSDSPSDDGIHPGLLAGSLLAVMSATTLTLLTWRSRKIGARNQI